jgi:hypothetical protein
MGILSARKINFYFIILFSVFQNIYKTKYEK